MESICTLLVDDNPEFLKSLELFLSFFKEFEIVGHAYSGTEAIIKLSSVKPDLVLIDQIMPEANGLATTRKINSISPKIRVFIFALFDNSQYREEATLVEADGFLSKVEIWQSFLPLAKKFFKKTYKISRNSRT